jgi:hypothetical protein
MEEEYRELLEAVLNSGVAADIDAGCEGYGPIANAMVRFGKTRKAANQEIFGKDADSLELDFGDESEE